MDACLFCQHPNPDGARFCNDCGTPLDMRPCFACNAVDKRSATHCHQCGAPFAPRPAAAPVPDEASAVPAAMAAAPPPSAPGDETAPVPPDREPHEVADPPVDGAWAPASMPGTAGTPWPEEKRARRALFLERALDDVALSPAPMHEAEAMPPPLDFRFAPAPSKRSAAHADADAMPSPSPEGEIPREPPARPEPTIVTSFAPKAVQPSPPAQASRGAPRTPGATEEHDELPRLIVPPLHGDEADEEQDEPPPRRRSRQRWFAGAALVVLGVLAVAVDRQRLRDPVATTTVVPAKRGEAGYNARGEAPALAASPARSPDSAPAEGETAPREAAASAPGACVPAVAALGLCDVGRADPGR